MIILKNKIITFSIGIVLSLTLLSPSIIQFSHLFEHHKHISCGDTTTHFHKKELDCSIQNFHLSTFSYSIYEYPAFQEKENYSEKFDGYNSIISFQNPVHFLRRGPPKTS